MAAAAFTRFNPRAFLENAARGATPAKAAKAAKAPEPEGAALATLATLAAGQSETANYASPLDAWTYAQAERAATVEYGCGTPRAWAKALARLDPNAPR